MEIKEKERNYGDGERSTQKGGEMYCFMSQRLGGICLPWGTAGKSE